MSVYTEITTDSAADCPRQVEPNPMDNGSVFRNTHSKSPTFIVTDPDSDIETDAVPNAPRPRGTPIPGSPKSDNVNDEPLTDQEQSEKDTCFSESETKTGKVPPGFFKNKIPKFGGNRVMYNVCNSHNVHFGNNIVFGANLGQPTAAHEEDRTPEEYEILLSSKKEVNDQHLDCVADNIGGKWKRLGLQLGMKESAIYRFEHDYKDDHRERVYQLLLEWKQSTGGQNQAPLLARISTALWLLRERDALDSLVKLEKDPRLNSQ